MPFAGVKITGVNCEGSLENSHCQWVYDGHWETDCGKSKSSFYIKGPVYNGYKYCPYCGRTLIESKITKEEFLINSSYR